MSKKKLSDEIINELEDKMPKYMSIKEHDIDEFNSKVNGYSQIGYYPISTTSFDGTYWTVTMCYDPGNAYTQRYLNIVNPPIVQQKPEEPTKVKPIAEA